MNSDPSGSVQSLKEFHLPAVLQTYLPFAVFSSVYTMSNVRQGDDRTSLIRSSDLTVRRSSMAAYASWMSSSVYSLVWAMPG